MPVEVSYDNTTTINETGPTKKAQKKLEEAQEVVQKVLEKEPDYVVVVPKEDRSTYIGRAWYHLKRGEPIAVPVEVRNLFAQAECILEV